MKKYKVTLENAKKFPGMLGKILPEMLREFGVYKCVINNEKVQFTLKT